jgi:serine/threonine protein kinase/Tol biopolymer transport system component
MVWQTDNEVGEINSDIPNNKTSRQAEISALGEGRYRIIGLAGKGGMSLVYHAYDSQNDRDVAIKVLSLELSSEENFLTRFQRESELMRDLEHPHILRAYDYGQEDNKVYLVMSYYGGGTLRERIVQGNLNLKQINTYLTQIASGLGYAHSRHIVHRDIKPSNVLIHHVDGKVVLSDFGIAKALTNSNPDRTGTIMGTPLYMAPEQFLDRVDKRSDIYSLGIVLYQMLCGEVPFKGDGIGFMHLNDPVPPLRTRGVPPVVERVVMKALAKRPEARFQTVEEMAAAFEEAVMIFANGETEGAMLVAMPGQTAATPNPALLSSQAQLSEMQIITPSQLPTERPGKTGLSPEETLPGNLEVNQLEITRPLKAINLQKTEPLALRLAPTAPQAAPEPARAGGTLVAVQAPPAPAPRPPKSKAGTIIALVIGLILLLSIAISGVMLLPGIINPTTTPTTISNTPTIVIPATTAAITNPVVVPTTHPPTAVPTQTSVVIGPGWRTVFTSRNVNGTSNIFLYDSQTGLLKQLTSGGTDSLAVWSPDGNAIVFQRDDKDLYRMAGDGTGQVLLVGEAINPDFSHLATAPRLAFISLKDNELYVADPTSATTEATRLTSTGGRPKRGPAWSYDDSRIAFAMEDDNKIYQIYTLDVTKANAMPIKLTSAGDENCLWPSFSPDGKQIAYSTNNNTSDIAKRLPLDIWVMNADGSVPSRIVGNLGHNSHPIWVKDDHSKTGSRIYFNSDRGPEELARIWVMNPDGSDQQLFIGHKSGQNEVKVDDFAVSVFPRK